MATQTMTNRNHASLVASGLTWIFALAVLTALVALLPPGVRAQAKPVADADIVARVNDDVITVADYQKAEQQLRDEAAHDCQGCPQDQIDAKFKDQQKDLLRNMIDQSLIVQRAKDMGISVESDLKKRLDEVRSRTASPASTICKRASKLLALAGKLTRPPFATGCSRKNSCGAKSARKWTSPPTK